MSHEKTKIENPFDFMMKSAREVNSQQKIKSPVLKSVILTVTFLTVGLWSMYKTMEYMDHMLR